MNYDYIVIGGGIIGLATAWTLKHREPDSRIVVVEKEATVGMHQSSHNSGVIHAGVYYPDGSLKAQFCRRGVDATLSFCRRYDVPARQCGKLIVATEASELARLTRLAEQARRNGLQVDEYDAAAIHEREPEIAGMAAIFVKETGIADYHGICHRLAALLGEEGVQICCSSAVEAIEASESEVIVETAQRTFVGGRLIVCAGLQADRVARLAGIRHDYVITPFRGDFYRLPDARRGLVNTLIYPVPDPSLPFLGVHLTVTTAGDLVLGPTAMLALAREEYRRNGFSPRDVFAMLTHPGPRRLLSKYPGAGLKELGYSVSRALYLRTARRYCPGLELSDLGERFCGIRAQLVDRRGNLVNDFVFVGGRRMLHVLNAPSPAATSAFPIAEEICRRLQQS